MKYTPHDYQKTLIRFVLSRLAGGLLVAPGMGKTSTILAAFSVLKEQRMASKMLVIAPLRVANSVWSREAAKWDEFQNLKVVLLHDKKKDELLASDADVYVINPEGLKWLTAKMAGKRWKWEVLIVDESTKFKHTNTQRFKLLKEMLPFFQRRYILTGSPAPNGLLDLFGQIYILDKGAALGRFITHYRMQYFDQTGFGGHTWVLRRGAEQRIYEKIAPLTIRLAAEDYLKLPPLIGVNPPLIHEVELPEEAMKTYRQMEDMLLAEVESGLVTAANAAVASGKCRQIANGGLYHNDGETFDHIHQAKIERIEDLIEEMNGKPALVAYEFKHDLVRLQRAFPEAPHLGGGITSTRQREIEDAWNAGQIPVLLVQPQSVAHGLNLQGTGGAIVFHSLTSNLEHYEQLIARRWRQGQTEPVVVHHIAAKDTVDQAIMKMIARKDQTQKSLLDALKEYARSRLAAA